MRKQNTCTINIISVHFSSIYLYSTHSKALHHPTHVLSCWYLRSFFNNSTLFSKFSFSWVSESFVFLSFREFSDICVLSQYKQCVSIFSNILERCRFASSHCFIWLARCRNKTWAKLPHVLYSTIFSLNCPDFSSKNQIHFQNVLFFIKTRYLHINVANLFCSSPW